MRSCEKMAEFKPLSKADRSKTFNGEGTAGSEGFLPLARSKSFVVSSSAFAHPGLSRYRGKSFDVLATTVGERKSLDKIVVITDTFSTGQLLASMLYNQGYSIVRVLSADLGDLLEFAPDGAVCEFIKTLVVNTERAWDSEMEILLAELRKLDLPISAVIAGAETGVELADELSERLGLPLSNGTALSEARRNKFVMGETVRAAGVRAVLQLKSCDLTEICSFLLSDWKPEPFRVIVKPLDSAGSDDVTLCLDLDQVRAAFTTIIGKVNGLGLVNSAVLVQEFLEGQEYVIDTVSRHGEHKVVAVWAYDRRAANGAQFVCHGQRLLTADEEHVRELIEYEFKVLDALGIKNGPTHGEVKWCRGEPVLVEVGARCHGGDGFWTDVCDEVYGGYNQAQLTIDAYLNPESFAKCPSVPLQRQAYGCLKWLISSQPEGTLAQYCPRDVAELKAMASYRGHQFFKEAGETVKPTQTCFTWAGCVKLANVSLSAMERDYARIEVLEATTLLQLEEKS